MVFGRPILIMGIYKVKELILNGKEQGHKAKGWYETGELTFEADKKDDLPNGLVKNYHKYGQFKN